MRTLFLIVLCAFNCLPMAAASKISAGAGWQHTSNSNYSDGVTANGRVETPIFWELSIGGEYEYHGPTKHGADSPTDGYYGDVSGHSILGEIIYHPAWAKVWRLEPYIFGGIGWGWWSFDRSSDLKDKGISVSLGDSLAKKVGLGLEWRISGPWKMALEWSYFHSHIPKDAYESDGTYSAILGDDRSHRDDGPTIGQEETNLLIRFIREF